MDSWQLMSLVVNSIAISIGVPGNALIVVVYATKRFRSSAHILIMGLAVADLMVCLTRPLDMFTGSKRGFHFFNNFKFWCKGSPVIAQVLSHWSIYVMALIAIERFFTVCRPHDRTLTPKRALLAIVACLIVALVVDFPIAIVSQIEEFPFFGWGKRCNDAAGPRWLDLLQKSFMNSLIILSLLVMIVLYTRVVIEVRRRTTVRPAGDNATTSVFTDAGSTLMSNPADDNSSVPAAASATTGGTKVNVSSDEYRGDNHDGAPSDHRDDGTRISRDTAVVNAVGSGRTSATATGGDATTAKLARKPCRTSGGRGKTTKMLLLTTAIFVITYLPTAGMNLIPDHILVTNALTQRKILLITFFIVRNVYILNHVINPILYGFINKRFRDDCRKIMRRMKCYKI